MASKIPHKEWIDPVERLPHPVESRMGYLRLDKNENTVPMPESVMNQIRKEITGNWMIAYPELHPLYKRMSRWLGVPPECLFATQGSDGVIRNTFEIFLKPGDRLLLMDPTYAMYNIYARLAGAKVETVSFGGSYTIPVERVLDGLKDGVRLFCIPNPNNPTGSVFSPEEMTAIFRKADKHGIMVLVDEAYYLYHPVSMAAESVKHPNVAVARSFSKAYGLAAARVGFGVAGPELAALFNKIRPVYEIGSFAALAAMAAIDHEDEIKANIDACLRGKEHLAREVEKMGFRTHPSHTNFLLIEVGSYGKAEAIARRLKEKGILIKAPFREKLLENCIRVTIAPPPVMDRFLEAFREVIKSL